MYNISDNPQYRLELKNTGSPAAVWILLTRHITDKVCTAGTTSSFGITDAVIHIRVDPVGT